MTSAQQLLESLSPDELEKLEAQIRAEVTVAEIDSIISPIKIGPCWQTDDDGAWKLPAKTLGWQIAGWCAEYLRAEAGGRWQFTLEQLRFILWWYAVDDNGRFIHRKGVLQRMKGWGKDPLLAVMCLVEFVGPSRFSHWAEDGSPVGIPHPAAWVQVTAVNQAQTTNTMSLIPSLMSDDFKAKYNITDGAVLIRANGGRQRLEAVTSSYRALEGKRTTFTLLNETHHWVLGNNGHKMYETIDGNSTKKDSRYLAITNAFLPGEDSVAERMRHTYDQILEGRAKDTGWMYDSLEASSRAPLSGPLLPLILERVRGDAVWLVIDTIIQSISDTTIAASRSRRMWLNQVVAEEEALHGPETWDPLLDPDAALMPGDEIAMGFDGGKTDDSTALVAVRLSDNLVIPLGVWERPSGPEGEDWEVNQEAVNSRVHWAFRTYKVRAFFADVALWESYITDWSTTYSEILGVKASERYACGWDMRSSLQRSTRAHEALLQAILDRKIKHDGDLTLRRHVMNTQRDVNNYGVSFRKESRESPRKVDAYAAMMLAYLAATEYRNRGKKIKTKTGRGYFL